MLGTMIALVVVGRLVLRTLVVWVFGQPIRTAVMVGVGLSQIGEFSFILVQVARSAGHVGADVYNATLATSLITILMNALLVRIVRGGSTGRRRTRRARARCTGASHCTSTSCCADSAGWGARSVRRSRPSPSRTW